MRRNDIRFGGRIAAGDGGMKWKMRLQSRGDAEAGGEAKMEILFPFSS
jgi:hypothetical protein